VTFLLVVGEDKAFYILEKLSTEHLRVCMEPTMDTTSKLLNTIYPLVARKNPQLHDYIEKYDHKLIGLKRRRCHFVFPNNSTINLDT